MWDTRGAQEIDASICLMASMLSAHCVEEFVALPSAQIHWVSQGPYLRRSPGLRSSPLAKLEKSPYRKDLNDRRAVVSAPAILRSPQGLCRICG